MAACLDSDVCFLLLLFVCVPGDCPDFWARRGGHGSQGHYAQDLEGHRAAGASGLRPPDVGRQDQARRSKRTRQKRRVLHSASAPCVCPTPVGCSGRELTVHFFSLHRPRQHQAAQRGHPGRSGGGAQGVDPAGAEFLPAQEGEATRARERRGGGGVRVGGLGN